MNLLHTKSFLLETFSGYQIPRYAILSHTWGVDEVTFQQLKNTRLSHLDYTRSRGWEKITNACKIARENDPPIDYIWIDTCCIDQDSSAQLSEAINSMFKWYERAGICYAYLEGVHIREEKALTEESIRTAPWFDRGWTLQELIAPADVVFFAEDWSMLGNKNSLCEVLSSRTGISRDVLLDPSRLPRQSVARRMSWAAARKTSRPEDIAYCLMGIFDVNMPLIYGEGRTKAFIRLQEEIIKNSEDQSLFGWQYDNDSFESEDIDYRENEGILAHHPTAFKNSFELVPHLSNCMPYRVTQRGLEIQFPLISRTKFQEDEHELVGVLSCHDETNLCGQIGIPLVQIADKYYRIRGSSLTLVDDEEAESAILGIVFVHKSGTRNHQTSSSSYCHLRNHPSDVSFSGGIASPAGGFPPNSGHDSIRAHASWKTTWKTIVLSTEYDGHIAALEFTKMQAYSNFSEPDGFTIIIRLFPNKFGPVAVIPWFQCERNAPEFLLRTLETYSHRSISAFYDFRFGQKHLRVALEKKRRFGRVTYYVDVEYTTADLPAPTTMAIEQSSDSLSLGPESIKRLR